MVRSNITRTNKSKTLSFIEKLENLTTKSDKWSKYQPQEMTTTSMTQCGKLSGARLSMKNKGLKKLSSITTKKNGKLFHFQLHSNKVILLLKILKRHGKIKLLLGRNRWWLIIMKNTRLWKCITKYHPRKSTSLRHYHLYLLIQLVAAIRILQPVWKIC